jgi:hypothetical protein
MKETPENTARRMCSTAGGVTALSRVGVVTALIAFAACSSGEHGTDAGGGADVDAPAPRCETPTQLAFCAATLDTQLAKALAGCPASPFYRQGPCGAAVAVTFLLGFTRQACFYDPTTKQLMASEDCSGDTGPAYCDGSSDCIHAGALDPACDSLAEDPSGLTDICSMDAGAAGAPPS